MVSGAAYRGDRQGEPLLNVHARPLGDLQVHRANGDKKRTAHAIRREPSLTSVPILALSEIKSSKAGVQLGFLFIDEPPFLDAPGVQAYCDALEAIQQRYGDLKVMAITHDPAMKSRFPQSVDVVKTPEGSKVIYE